MRRLVLIASFLPLFLSFTPTPAWAQSVSLGIYPPVLEVQTIPPSSPTSSISIQNFDDNEVNLSIELIPIQMDKDATGNVLLNPGLLKGGFYGYYYGRIQFLSEGKKIESINLQPQETKQIQVSINLHKGDPPGDYYYAIVFLSSGKLLEDTSLASIPAGIATNLLLSVGPKSPAIGGITEFTTDSFKNNGPVEFTLKLHNASSHLVNPTGTIRIKNILGKQVEELNILPQYILAQSDRYLTGQDSSPSAQFNSSLNPKIIWKEKFLLGFYSATANLKLEENGNIITAKTYFFAFPLYLLFIIVIILFVAAGIYLRVRKKIQ